VSGVRGSCGSGLCTPSRLLLLLLRVLLLLSCVGSGVARRQLRIWRQHHLHQAFRRLNKHHPLLLLLLPLCVLLLLLLLV
jgi:hypothetical protein